jgi:serine/threonine-protein kinase RIO1
VGVPNFYGAGNLVLDDQRAIVPRVLVVEYISDAVSLHNLQDSGDIGSLKAWHVEALEDVFRKVNKAGVTHQDVDTHNLLIGPKRVVVVDFGQAYIRPRGSTNKQ